MVNVDLTGGLYINVSSSLTIGESYLLEAGEGRQPIELVEQEGVGSMPDNNFYGVVLYPSNQWSLNGRRYMQVSGFTLWARSGDSVLVIARA